MDTRTPRPLYLLTVFGLRNPWVYWRLQRGALDEWCETCCGVGVVIERPCLCAEPATRIRGACQECTRDEGCEHCRARCPQCRGSKLRRSDPLMAEDFGDAESRRIAEALFPGLKIDDDPYHVRMDTRHLR